MAERCGWRSASAAAGPPPGPPMHATYGAAACSSQCQFQEGRKSIMAELQQWEAENVRNIANDNRPECLQPGHAPAG